MKAIRFFALNCTVVMLLGATYVAAVGQSNESSEDHPGAASGADYANMVMEA